LPKFIMFASPEPNACNRFYAKARLSGTTATHVPNRSIPVCFCFC
jgi:hypothetical protein